MIVLNAIHVHHARGEDAAAILFWKLLQNVATQEPESADESTRLIEHLADMLAASLHMMRGAAQFLEFIDTAWPDVKHGAPPAVHEFRRELRELIGDLRRAVPRDGQEPDED